MIEPVNQRGIGIAGAATVGALFVLTLPFVLVDVVLTAALATTLAFLSPVVGGLASRVRTERRWKPSN